MSVIFARLLIAGAALSLGIGMASADEYQAVKYPRARPTVATSEPYILQHEPVSYPVPLQPLCEDGPRNGLLLHCSPQVVMAPSEAGIEAWNAITSIKRHQPRPYQQLFTWDR